MKQQIREYEQVISKAYELFTQFPQETHNEEIFSQWSLKDLISHFNHWAVHEVNEVKAVINDTPRSWIPNIDKYNVQGIARREANTFKDTLAEFKEINKQVIESYLLVPQDKWKIEMYKGKKYNLEWFLAISIEHYTKEHFPEMLKILEKT